MTTDRPEPDGTRLGELWRILPEEATANADGVLEIDIVLAPWAVMSISRANP